MNHLQHISERKFGPVLVTLNPPAEPDKKTVLGRWKYEHPVLDSQVCADLKSHIVLSNSFALQAIFSQSQMHYIQNVRGISFAGAYLRYGFHEDGFTSGMRAAVEHLGVKPPFEIEDPDRRPTGVWVGYLFDLLEYSGVAMLLKAAVWIWITGWKIILGLFLDLRHLDI